MGWLRGIGTAGAVVAGGAAGGLVGSYTGAPESPNTITGAAIGAAGGAVLANGGTAMLGKGVLGAANLGGAAILGGAGLIGSAAMKAAPAIGLGALRGTAGMINGVSASAVESSKLGTWAAGKIGVGATKGLSGIAAKGLSPFGRHVGAVGNFAEGLIDFSRPTSTLNPVKQKGISGAMEKVGGVKLTNPYTGAKRGAAMYNNKIAKGLGAARGALINGATVVGASTLITGAMGAYNEYKNMKMGVMDNYVTNATPRTPVYEQNGGATGDLVFAMNKLRN